MFLNIRAQVGRETFKMCRFHWLSPHLSWQGIPEPSSRVWGWKCTYLETYRIIAPNNRTYMFAEFWIFLNQSTLEAWKKKYLLLCPSSLTHTEELCNLSANQINNTTARKYPLPAHIHFFTGGLLSWKWSVSYSVSGGRRRLPSTRAVQGMDAGVHSNECVSCLSEL